ncbi:MAG: hypothetical protein WC980_01880 [Candidatus Brocadiia bacterium]
MKKVEQALAKTQGRFELIAMMQQKLRNLRQAGIKQTSGTGIDHLSERVLDDYLSEAKLAEEFAKA